LLSPQDGQPVDLNRIENIKGKGEQYTVVKAEEKQEYENLLGDRWRKIVLEVEPLRHIEAQKAIEYMRMGSNILRYTGNGYPHIRLFQLSDDLKRLIWFSGTKNINESRIDLRKITSITIGQKTEKFQKYPLPGLCHLSFSIHYNIGKGKEDSLDLICKDELEFDLWVTGIRALSYHFKGYNISKMLLLGHSRVFNEELKHKKIGSANKFLVEQDQEVYRSKSLVDSLLTKQMTPSQLNDKVVVLGKKIRSMRQRIDDIADEVEHTPTGSDSVGMGYVSIAEHEERADDKSLQVSKMYELVDNSDKRLEKIKKIISDYECDSSKKKKKKDSDSEDEDKVELPKVAKDDPIKFCNNEIWAIEIDLE
jgi:hypothetical protein